VLEAARAVRAQAAGDALVSAAAPLHVLYQDPVEGQPLDQKS
jgi:hypothetical protein